MANLQTLIYEDAKAGGWQRLDAEECGCQGSGWFCSDVDTWHKCYAHPPECTTCCHPDAASDYCEKEWQGPIQETAPVAADDTDIPF